MDKIDEEIIRIIERRVNLSSRALSKMLSVPISTVQRRIKKLEQKGVIIGYKAIINYEKTSRTINTFILIELSEVGDERDHIPKKSVLDSLRKLNEIEEITEVQAANFDVIIKVRLESLKKLSEFVEELRSIKGIDEASTAIITEETIVPPLILS